MAQKSCIPGYDEALAEERRIREEAFLGRTAFVCGVEVNQITPYLLARIFRMRTPFFGVGEHDVASVAKFLWVLSPSFSTRQEDRLEFAEKTTMRIVEMGLDAAIAEVESFIDSTFLDAPEGGNDSIPYACSIAWMVHRMAMDPHRWDEERTLNSPIRRIYQYIKCAKQEKGDVVFNSISDPLRAKWLQDLRDGKVTLN